MNKFMVSLREKANLTQADVSKRLGYTTPQYISNIERGRCMLAPAKFKKAAKIYGVKPMVLVDHWLDTRRAQLLKQLGK